MSIQAKLYTLTIIFIGGVLGVWLLSGFPSEQKVPLVIAAILASALQILAIASYCLRSAP